MKKLTLLAMGFALIFLLMSSFALGETEIKVGKGDLKIGGILQAGYTYFTEDTLVIDRSDPVASVHGFTLNRARFLFWGTIVPDKVKYFVQLEHKGGVGVLDYKAQFFYIDKTEITVGRFLPNFTIYMPYSTAKLELINYPLTTTKYAMWRQVGIQSTTTTDYVNFNLGIFNGYPANNTADNNNAKDFLGRVEFKPPVDNATICFGGYAWMGAMMPPSTYGGYPVEELDSETLKANRFGGFAKADYTTDDITVRFRGEFLMATTEELYYSHMDSVCEEDSRAFFVQGSIQPDPRLEFLARFEMWDPNTDSGVEHDDLTVFTGGANYYLEGLNTMFYLNYIHRMQDVCKESSTKDDNGNWESKSEGIVQAQVQILF
jgi:hypothetical protein